MLTDSYVMRHSSLYDPSQSRQTKPRQTGITMVIDKGLGLHALEDLLQTGAEFIDYLKMGFGTTALYPSSLLKRKVSLAKEHGVKTYPGGTFLEVALAQSNLDSYFQLIEEVGFSALEISDGTLSISLQQRQELIRRAKDEGYETITEYGKKITGEKLHLGHFLEVVQTDLNEGVSFVIVEGRESGKGVGVYDVYGECDTELVNQILGAMSQPEKLLWEAPQKEQQLFFLRHVGRNVNLGNIAPHEVYSLEALRRGLRSDTLVIPMAFEEV